MIVGYTALNCRVVQKDGNWKGCWQNQV